LENCWVYSKEYWTETDKVGKKVEKLDAPKAVLLDYWSTAQMDYSLVGKLEFATDWKLGRMKVE
jgi:hypothetical protein